jgi:RNA polymerase sigma factor (sigma-70 family)
MLTNQETELALWEALTLGDREAYTALYKAYHPRLYNYGHKFTNDSRVVEDCIQEVLVRIWTGRNKLAEVMNIRSYLFVSFRHCILKALQHDQKWTPFHNQEQYSFSIEVSIDQVMINKERIYERQIHLKHAVDKLTARQKEAVFFLFFENLSYEEVSHILSISKKATYKLVARALTELRTIYKQQDVLFMLPNSLLVLSLALLAF